MFEFETPGTTVINAACEESAVPGKKVPLPGTTACEASGVPGRIVAIKAPASTAYCPGGTLPIRKNPSSFVTTVARLFPSIPIRLTRTDATGLPSGSRICPLRTPSAVCPSAGRHEITTISNKRFIITEPPVAECFVQMRGFRRIFRDRGYAPPLDVRSSQKFHLLQHYSRSVAGV